MDPLTKIKKSLVNCEAFLSLLLSEIRLLRVEQQKLQLALAGVAGRQADRLLTPQEAASLLKISLRTLKNWERSGKLLPVWVGAHPYYLESHLFKI